MSEQQNVFDTLFGQTRDKIDQMPKESDDYKGLAAELTGILSERLDLVLQGSSPEKARALSVRMATLHQQVMRLALPLKEENSYQI